MLAIYTYPFIILYTGDTSVVSINDNNDSDIANTTLITGTTIGTTLVVIIILFFTIVIMCVKKKKFRIVYYYRGTINVTNDGHGNKDKKHTCHECDDISHCNEVKLETANCLYEPTNIETVDVPITPNPAYSVNPNSIQTGKKLNHQYDYIETGYLEPTTTEEAHNNNATNPASVGSYSTQDIMLQDNPSYVKL